MLTTLLRKNGFLPGIKLKRRYTKYGEDMYPLTEMPIADMSETKIEGRR